jgi:hypothetical protein
MINNYIERTDMGYELKEGWQDEIFSGMSYENMLKKKREIGSVVKISWFNDHTEKTIFFEGKLQSSCISDDRAYISIALGPGIFLYSDNAEIVIKIIYPIFYEKIEIESGRVVSQKIIDGELKFKVLSENQDFYVVYSIDKKAIIKVEWCR